MGPYVRYGGRKDRCSRGTDLQNIERAIPLRDLPEAELVGPLIRISLESKLSWDAQVVSFSISGSPSRVHSRSPKAGDKPVWRSLRFDGVVVHTEQGVLAGLWGGAFSRASFAADGDDGAIDPIGVFEGKRVASETPRPRAPASLRGRPG
jgi:hypothetical protein